MVIRSDLLRSDFRSTAEEDWVMVGLSQSRSHEEDNDDASVQGLTRAASVSSSSSSEDESYYPLSSQLPGSDVKEVDFDVRHALVGLDSEESEHIRQSQKSRIGVVAKVLLLILPFALATLLVANPVLTFDGEDSIYVPGVGFSGFWFTLGRLKSIEDPASKNYVCFSAGCLGAVTILNNFTVDEMACMATSAQSAWKKGEITRYGVISEFVDGVVYRTFPRNPVCVSSSEKGGDDKAGLDVPISNPDLLSRLHILTSTRNGLFGMRAVMRSPIDLEELREMLIQTTWIPGATGYGFHHKDHMDGGFSLFQHPKCDQTVYLPLDAELWFNSLNVNMGEDKAYRLWNSGLAYGL